MDISYSHFYIGIDSIDYVPGFKVILENVVPSSVICCIVFIF